MNDSRAQDGTTTRRLAVDALVRIDTQGAYANLLVPSLLEGSSLSLRDRGFVTELVYGVTRRRRWLDHVLEGHLLRDPPPAARAALRLGAYQLLELGTPAHAAVSATVEASPRRFRGLVNAVLRKVSTHEVPPAPRAVELSYPDWIVDLLIRDLGEDRAISALRTMNEPAVVHRRDDGYVQDPSSVLVADAVTVEPGWRVLDVCAAPGGKATALAARGAFVAGGDRLASRAGLIVDNAARVGAQRVAVFVGDGTMPPFAPGVFDAVLVDAPCSGLGALRRRPDARWRIDAAAVERLAAVQRRLLEAAAPLVRPGGELVYSVCTLTTAETEEVAATVNDRREFEPVGALGDPWTQNGCGFMVEPAADHDGMALFRWTRAA